ncbi:MAG TPA: GHMP kinase [bacterium]|nr:GHMP kinase [bacterium]
MVAYNRIDGPGSSLDLREFQEAFWRLPFIPRNLREDPAATWSKNLPRTVGITISTGTRVDAKPHPEGPGRIGVRSAEYLAEETDGEPGAIPPTKGNWLLKIVDLFGLSGVMFDLHNLHAGTHSAGLGGSATAATGVCILANELAGRPFSDAQLVAMASLLEQDLGVSITGTQEQSNVVFGGVRDYVWFPWGIPGWREGGYGESLRFELLPPEFYEDLEQRMVVFHSGKERASSSVNSEWRKALATSDGYAHHRTKLEIAYQYREGIRRRDWDQVHDAITRYRSVRTRICPAYMEGSTQIVGCAEHHGCTGFPLGAGGGGGVLVFGKETKCLDDAQKDLVTNGHFHSIRFKIRRKGHELVNLPLQTEA